MRILVTGASGFIGRALVPALLAAGHEVRAVGRARSDMLAGVEHAICGDLADHIDWEPLLAGIDVIVHLAGIAHATRAVQEELYERVNHAATASLARAAARARVARIVFVSSIRAQTGPVSVTILSERDEPRPTDPYGRSKLAAEESIRSSGARYTILRPVLVYGRQLKGNLGLLRRLARLPVPLPFGAFDNRRSLLAMDGLVSAIMLAVSSPELENETFIVADKTALSLREIVSILQVARGRAPRTLAVPPRLVRSLLRIAGKQEMWDRIGGELVVDASKLEAAGWRPVADTRAALVRTAGAA